MYRRDWDLNPALRTLKKSYSKIWIMSLYWSSSCCLHHILGHTNPNEVNQNSNDTRNLGEKHS